MKSKKNPTEVSPLSEEAIAARARLIWQKNGGGDGRDVENWLQAETELRMEQSQLADQQSGRLDQPVVPQEGIVRRKGRKT